MLICTEYSCVYRGPVDVRRARRVARAHGKGGLGTRRVCMPRVTDGLEIEV